MSIETSVPQQAGGFIISFYIRISNNAACKEKMYNYVSLSQDMPFFIGFPIPRQLLKCREEIDWYCSFNSVKKK